MKKLTSEQIELIVEKHSKGATIVDLSIEFNISKLSIYYYLRTNKTEYVEKPMCYIDYIKNNIYNIEQKLKNNEYTDEQRKFALSERRRLKRLVRVSNLRQDKTP